MDFDFAEAETRLLEAVRSAARALPSADEAGAAAAEAARKTLREGLKSLAAAGYLDLGLDDASPGSAATRMAAMEIVAACAPGFFLAVEMSTRVLGRALVRWGSGSRMQTRLQDLRQGEWLGALALSEDTLNVENDPLGTRGIRRNGRIVLNGRKDYVINAPLADRIGVVGLLEGRTAVFMVDRRAPGLILTDRIRTMGYEGVHMAGLSLVDCILSDKDVLLPPEGEPVLERLRAWENEVLLAAALGQMQAAYAEARDFAKTQRSGGKPIIAYQEVGFKLAEMLTLLQTAQLLAYRTVWTLETASREDPALLLCAKVFATEAAERVCGEALRILSGQGFRSGSAAEAAYRAAKWTQIAGISTEIARVKIGDAALGYR